MADPNSEDKRDLMRVWGRFIRLNGRLESAVSTQLREIGLSIPQFDLLSALLQQEGQSQQDIAERLFVTKGNVSGLVDRLAGAGLVERRATAGDRRSHALFLTAAGRKLAESGMRTHESYVSDTLGRLPPADRASLERLLIAWRDTVRAEAERAPRPEPA